MTEPTVLDVLAAHPGARPDLHEIDYEELPAARNGRRPKLRASDATNLAGVDTGRHTLSHTRLSVWLACHRKFELSYLKRLEQVERPRYFTLGSAYQKAIEWQDPQVGLRFLEGFEPCETCKMRGYTGNSTMVTGDTIPLPDSSMFKEIDGQTVYLGPTCTVCDGTGWTGEQIIFHTEQAETYHLVNRAIVEGASTLYLKRWPTPIGETREVEYKVRLRSPWTGAYSNTYDLLGYADGVIDREFGETDHPLELVENKLVGRLDEATILSLPLNRQLALERYGIWRATGRPVTRVWYRWMKKPAIKQRGGRKQDKSDAETLTQFCERIVFDYSDRPEFYAIEEDPKFITTQDLLRVEADLWECAADMRSYLHNGPDGRRRSFPRDTTRCGEYGGCDYLPICTGQPDANALYNVRPKRSARHESAPEAE